jgi:Cys-rich repeat protein
MMRRALAAAIALGLPVTLASGACGTEDWAFCDLATGCDVEAGFDVAALVDAQLGAPERDAPGEREGSADGPCDPDAMRCPVSCAGGAPCPNDAPVCTAPYAICQPCRSNDDCNNVRSGPNCNQAGQCVPECSSDRNCPSSRPRCDRPIGRCVRCLSNSDCPSGEACHSNHTCGPP